MKVRIVDADDVEVPFRRGLVDVDEPIRPRERKRPQEERVDEAEHHDVGADAERQHGRDQRRRGLLPGQPPERVTEVGAEHGRPPF